MTAAKEKKESCPICHKQVMDPFPLCKEHIKFVHYLVRHKGAWYLTSVGKKLADKLGINCLCDTLT